MQETTQVANIKEREWQIVPLSLEESVELCLAFCTGIVAFNSSINSPYLIVHSPPTVGGGIPVLSMDDAMHGKYYNQSSDNTNRISLTDVFAQYIDELTKVGSNTSCIGIYMASGNRANPTDLAILRNFIMDSRFSVFGAELNEMVRLRLVPNRGIIQFMNLAEEIEIRPHYVIGTRYGTNLRTS